MIALTFVHIISYKYNLVIQQLVLQKTADVSVELRISQSKTSNLNSNLLSAFDYMGEPFLPIPANVSFERKS